MQRVTVQRATLFFRSIKNAVISRVPVHWATPSLNKERCHIAGPSSTEPYIIQMCICNIYRVESSITISSYGKQCITHTNSVKHNNIFIFEDRSRLVFYTYVVSNIHPCKSSTVVTLNIVSSYWYTVNCCLLLNLVISVCVCAVFGIADCMLISLVIMTLQCCNGVFLVVLRFAFTVILRLNWRVLFYKKAHMILFFPLIC